MVIQATRRAYEVPTDVGERAGERLRALAAYGLASDRPLPSLDPVVNIAVRVFDMPASAVNMIGSDHVFFAASAGIGDVDMSRDVSVLRPCHHAERRDGRAGRHARRAFP